MWYKLIFSKGGLYVGIGLLILGLFSYFLYSWHYNIIDNLEQEATELRLENKSKDITINNLGVEIVQLIEQNKVTGFEEYFEGGGDVEVNPYGNNNIFLKRVQ